MNGFTIYKEYYDLITLLNQKEQEQLSLALFKYMFEDIEPDLNENQMKIFRNLKRPLDASKSQSKRRTKKEPEENQKKTGMEPNKNPNKTHQDVIVDVSNYDNNYVVNVNVNSDLFSFIEEQFGRTLSHAEYELISTWEDNELTRYAIKQTSLNRATSLKYTQSILDSFKAKGFKTLTDVEKDEKKFQEQKKERTKTPYKNQFEKNMEVLEKIKNDER